MDGGSPARRARRRRWFSSAANGAWMCSRITPVLTGAGKSGLGIAIDLGTTTIAAQMIDLATGSVLGVETNSQSPGIVRVGCDEQDSRGLAREPI